MYVWTIMADRDDRDPGFEHRGAMTRERSVSTTDAPRETTMSGAMN